MVIWKEKQSHFPSIGTYAQNNKHGNDDESKSFDDIK